MRRLTVSAIIVLTMILVAVPPVLAGCDTQSNAGCRRTIAVIPTGAVKTGDPIVTMSPASLTMFHTGKGPIQNIWLLIVINKATYDALDEITTNDTTFMTKANFKEVRTAKIPSTQPNETTRYPGSECQYEVNAIRDKISQKEGPIYYAITFFLTKITTTPTPFQLTIELNAPADLKALILALGRYDKDSCGDRGTGINCVPAPTCPKPFNACSSYSKSTLVVPEAATMAIMTAPITGIAGLYAVKRRKR
jgi:hypothetical protein